jgi:anti-anti-sigma regulatory factor
LAISGTAVAQPGGNMLRISEVTENGVGPMTLRLEGHVTGPWVGELLRVCTERLGHRRALILDLAGVAFLDSDGIALFGDLASRQVIFRNASPFIAEQLRGVADVER